MFGQRQGYAVAALGLCLFASKARADEPTIVSAAVAAPAAGVTSRPSLLPAAPRLQLSWPVAPLSFSFRASQEGNYANGPLQLFRAESVWLRRGPFSLLSVSSGERAFELDCRSTCQPALERAMSLEARVHLYSGPVVREVHGYVSRGLSWGEMTDNKRRTFTRFGLAGTFD
jgi:hypothetical protein